MIGVSLKSPPNRRVFRFHEPFLLGVDLKSPLNAGSLVKRFSGFTPRIRWCVLRRDYPYIPIPSKDGNGTLNPIRSGGVWILRVRNQSSVVTSFRILQGVEANLEDGIIPVDVAVVKTHAL